MCDPKLSVLLPLYDEGLLGSASDPLPFRCPHVWYSSVPSLRQIRFISTTLSGGWFSYSPVGIDLLFGQKTIIFITLKLLAWRTDSLERLPSVILQHQGVIIRRLGYSSDINLPWSWCCTAGTSVYSESFSRHAKVVINVLVFFSNTTVCAAQVCKFIRCWKILSVCSDFRSLSLPPSSFCWSSGRSVQRSQRDWLYSLTHANGREIAAPGHDQKCILMLILSPHSTVVEALNETDSLILLRDTEHV